MNLIIFQLKKTRAKEIELSASQGKLSKGPFRSSTEADYVARTKEAPVGHTHLVSEYSGNLFKYSFYLAYIPAKTGVRFFMF